jgi:putative aldouronate transport system substrate-binding protein
MALTNPQMRRRNFVRFLGLGGGAVPLLLAACSSGAPQAATPAAGPSVTQTAGSVVFPTYQAAVNRPTPDFPSKGAQYEDGYNNYPPNPVRTVTQPPGLGSSVTAFVQPLQPPPTALDQNPAWQEVNRQLNAQIQFNMVPVADYRAKLSTLMAGDDLPDLINVFRGINGIANLPPFLEAKCADLSPYLAGDAAKDYPNLAAIPTFAWRNSGSVINHHIYMVPVERYAPGTLLLKNAKIYDQEIGADYVPRDLDDYKRILVQLNRPAQARYATGAYQGVAFNVEYYAAAFGAPNNWMVDASGRFTKSYETAEYKAAVGYARDLVAAGVYHPNSLTNTSIKQGETDFVAAKQAVFISSFGNPWNDVWRQARSLKDPFDILFVPPFPAHSGGKPAHFLGLGFQSATALKKAPPERIKELLGILNYLAAPFGSVEDLLLTAGIPGTDYTLDGKGNPVLTDRGNSDANNVPWKYVLQRPQVMYLPDIPNYAKTLYDVEQALNPIGVADPSLGLYAPTDSSKGVTAQLTWFENLTDIVAGRRPMADFDQLLKDWQNSAGNQVRTELMRAYAADAA